MGIAKTTSWCDPPRFDSKTERPLITKYPPLNHCPTVVTKAGTGRGTEEAALECALRSLILSGRGCFPAPSTGCPLLEDGGGSLR